MSEDDLQTQRKKAIAECIGILSMEFSRLEFHVDALIAYFHDFFYGSTIERRKPRAFGRKVEYLHAGFTRLDTMQWAAVYLPVLTRLDNAGKLRNWFVHGYLVEVGNERNITFVRHAFDVIPVGLERRTFVYDEIYDLAVEVRDLSTNMHGLLEVVMTYVDKAYPEVFGPVEACEGGESVGRAGT